MATWSSAIGDLIQGLSLIGNAVNFFIRSIFSLIGIDIPDTYIRVATIVAVLIVLWKAGSAMNKIIFFGLVLLVLSQAAGLFTGLSSTVRWPF
jgi:hypothetical protein